VTDAELRSLLLDCLKLWGVAGSVTAGAEGLLIATAAARCVVRRGAAPTRWFIETPARRRPVPSIVALLSALRRALGADGGARLRVGGG
jgi:hypothetical protein